MYYFQNYHNINDLNEVDQFGQNVLHISTNQNHYELSKYILQHGKINLFAQDCNGCTVLHTAAKSGLAKICWLITQKNNGECIRLAAILNNQNQTPFDLIRNEKKESFMSIKKWLSLETKTNNYLLEKNFAEKKRDFPSLNGNHSKSIFSSFKWNSENDRRLNWLLEFMKFPLLITVPMLINMLIFDKNDFYILQGIFGYSTFIVFFATMAMLKHRIKHISGTQNPLLFGLIFIVLFHNYTTYFFSLLECNFKFFFLSLYNRYIDLKYTPPQVPKFRFGV